MMEREFLVRLAATWLKCRLEVMGGVAGNARVRDMKDLGYALMGMVDYAAEMRVVSGGRAFKSL